MRELRLKYYAVDIFGPLFFSFYKHYIWRRGHKDIPMALKLPAVAPFSVGEKSTFISQWKEWVQGFGYYLVAWATADKKQQRALLLHLAGPEIQEIFQTLSETGDDYKTMSTSSLRGIFPSSATPSAKLRNNNKKQLLTMWRVWKLLQLLASFLSNSHDQKRFCWKVMSGVVNSNLVLHFCTLLLGTVGSQYRHSFLDLCSQSFTWLQHV